MRPGCEVEDLDLLPPNVDQAAQRSGAVGTQALRVVVTGDPAGIVVPGHHVRTHTVRAQVLGEQLDGIAQLLVNLDARVSARQPLQRQLPLLAVRGRRGRGRGRGPGSR